MSRWRIEDPQQPDPDARTYTVRVRRPGEDKMTTVPNLDVRAALVAVLDMAAGDELTVNRDT